MIYDKKTPPCDERLIVSPAQINVNHRTKQTTMKHPHFKVKCSVCEKVTSGRLPKNGDGTFYYPRRHNFKGKSCKGNIEEGEIIDIKHTQTPTQ